MSLIVFKFSSRFKFLCKLLRQISTIYLSFQIFKKILKLIENDEHFV